MISVLLLTCFIHIVAGDSTCADIDTEACKLMQQKQPDLCATSIAEAACQRYCGKCPLDCFSCPDLVQDMSQCTNVVTCSLNQTCYTTEVFDFDRSHGFTGGCMPKDLCVPHRGQLFGRSSSTVQTSCCDTEKCNGRI